MSAQTLRSAAKVLREHAENATPGPWEHVDYSSPSGQPMTKEGLPSTFRGCGSVVTLDEELAGGDIAGPNGDLYPRSGYSPKDDMALIALMHPPVALALADWLDRVAKQIEEFATEIAGEERPGDLTEADEAAITTARAILREEA